MRWKLDTLQKTAEYTFNINNERKRSEGEIENTNFPVRNTDLSSLKSSLEYFHLHKIKIFFIK